MSTLTVSEALAMKAGGSRCPWESPKLITETLVLKAQIKPDKKTLFLSSQADGDLK